MFANVYVFENMQGSTCVYVHFMLLCCWTHAAALLCWPGFVVLLQFSALGVGCAGAAVLLYEGIRVSEVILRPLPRWASAPLGGLLCGIIAFKFPQVTGQQWGPNMSGRKVFGGRLGCLGGWVMQGRLM